MSASWRKTQYSMQMLTEWQHSWRHSPTWSSARRQRACRERPNYQRELKRTWTICSSNYKSAFHTRMCRPNCSHTLMPVSHWKLIRHSWDNIASASAKVSSPTNSCVNCLSARSNQLMSTSWLRILLKSTTSGSSEWVLSLSSALCKTYCRRSRSRTPTGGAKEFTEWKASVNE